KAFLFGTNAASVQVTSMNTVLATNRAALFVWHQFSAESQRLIRDPNQPTESRAQAIRAEFNKLIAGPSLYDTNRFVGIELETDARLMLNKELNPASLSRLNRLLLEQVFSKDVAKLYRIGPEEMLSVNSIFIMIFIPILTWGVYPLLGRWARPLRRMSVGLFLTAFSYVVVAWLQTRVDAGEAVSILWQTAPYVILTLAEVLVSTTGLEFAFTQAAPTMKSTIMGFWYLTIALGNLLVLVITSVLGGGHGEGSVTPQRFMLYAGMTFVVAILFSLIALRYRYRDTLAAEP